MARKYRRRYWTPAEEELLRRRYADTPTELLAKALERDVKGVLAKANSMGLHKSRELIAEIARERSRRPDHGGRVTMFRPGLVPWNKGSSYTARGRCAETQFKPGHKPHTWQPVGSYRIVVSKTGGRHLELKVCDDPGPNSVRWKPVHRLVWEAEHGPVPAGHVVTFREGRRTLDAAEITLDAVELITREELMRRNTVHNLPPEFAEIARLKAVLHRAINDKTRRSREEEKTA